VDAVQGGRVEHAVASLHGRLHVSQVADVASGGGDRRVAIEEDDLVIRRHEPLNQSQAHHSRPRHQVAPAAADARR
jgi:hypothetical protein